MPEVCRRNGSAIRPGRCDRRLAEHLAAAEKRSLISECVAARVQRPAGETPTEATGTDRAPHSTAYFRTSYLVRRGVSLNSSLVRHIFLVVIHR